MYVQTFRCSDQIDSVLSVHVMAVSDETLHEMAAACYAASWSSWPSLSDLRNAALTSDETLHEMAAACYAASRWSWPSLSDL